MKKGSSEPLKCHVCKGEIGDAMVKIRGWHDIGSKFLHPECHNCSVCKKRIAVGDAYEWRKGQAKCKGCYDEWEAQVSTLPFAERPKLRPPGYVWDQVKIIESMKPQVAPIRGPSDDPKSGPLLMGKCESCKNPVYGQVITIRTKKGGRSNETKKLCPDCHRCVHCSEKFGLEEAFIIDKNKTYHQQCYLKAITIEDQKYRQQQQQQQQGGGEPIITQLASMSLGTCVACSGQIADNVVTLNNGKKFHPQCHKCLKCSHVFAKGEAFFTESNGALCENCG